MPIPFRVEAEESRLNSGPDVDDKHYSPTRLARSFRHFVLGKGVSALLTMIAFALVARLLPPTSYGTYVSLVAMMELGLALSSVGLDWVTARMLPEYRIHAGGKALIRFTLCLGALRTGILLTVGAGIIALAGSIAELIRQPRAVSLIQLYAAVMIVEGIARFLRDDILGNLLLQGALQAAQVLRTIVLVAGLYWLTLEQKQDVSHVIVVDLLSACTGMLIALIGLSAALLRSVSMPASQGWEPPSISDMRALAANTYVSYVLTLAYSGQFLTLLLSRYAGAEATAVFGFARNLAEQIRRLLPTEMFMGLIRPMLVARYVETKDFDKLNLNAGLILRIGFAALTPLCVFFVAFGQETLTWLSKGKFGGSYHLMLVLLAYLAVFGHRRVIEMVANVAGHAYLCTRAGFFLLAVPGLAVVVLELGWGPIALVSAMFLGDLAFGILVARGLNRRHLAYTLPAQSLVKIAVGGLCAAALALAIPFVPTGPLQLLLAGSTVLGISTACLWIANPISGSDMSAMRTALAKLKPVC
jgi:O-antigen/teichoic acid export membrane protein